MHRYQATIQWHHTKGIFADKSYSRKHSWFFDGDVEIPASASPQIVPEPYSDPLAVDPEEAFVASLASCHMLWFLSLAANKGYDIQSYKDSAEGVMEKNAEGKLAITEVILKPLVIFEQDSKLNRRSFDKIHDQAHTRCFIAQSVKTDIVIDAQFEIS